MLWQAVSPPNNVKVQELSILLKIPYELAYLLVQRGITTFDQAKNYFRPVPSSLHDPYLMKDMNAAVERISHAIENQDPVMVY